LHYTTVDQFVSYIAEIFRHDSFHLEEESVYELQPQDELRKKRKTTNVRMNADAARRWKRHD
jgi:hypothetical protein